MDNSQPWGLNQGNCTAQDPPKLPRQTGENITRQTAVGAALLLPKLITTFLTLRRVFGRHLALRNGTVAQPSLHRAPTNNALWRVQLPPVPKPVGHKKRKPSSSQLQGFLIESYLNRFTHSIADSKEQSKWQWFFLQSLFPLWHWQLMS